MICSISSTTWARIYPAKGSSLSEIEDRLNRTPFSWLDEGNYGFPDKEFVKRLRKGSET